MLTEINTNQGMRRGRPKTLRSQYPREDAIRRAMIHRCASPSNISYSNYGGRGITVCERWIKGEDGKPPLECFIEDMGPRPSENHSIDRINNNGNYEPSNCRWADKWTQAKNRRPARFSWHGYAFDDPGWEKKVYITDKNRHMIQSWRPEKNLSDA